MYPPGKDIINRAAIILQDLSAIRWTTDELVGWLNDGQRAVQVRRPDSTSVYQIVKLAGGARQDLTKMTLDPPPAQLIELVRSVGEKAVRRAMRLVSRTVMDVQVPQWQVMPAVLDIRNYMYDPRTPNIFFVYPPAQTEDQSDLDPAKWIPAVEVEIVYSAYPKDLPLPGPGKFWNDVVGSCSIVRTYENPLIDYILYRAWLKDAEYAGNEQRAKDHYAAFEAPLAIDVQSSLAAQPKSNKATA